MARSSRDLGPSMNKMGPAQRKRPARMHLMHPQGHFHHRLQPGGRGHPGAPHHLQEPDQVLDRGWAAAPAAGACSNLAPPHNTVNSRLVPAFWQPIDLLYLPSPRLLPAASFSARRWPSMESLWRLFCKQRLVLAVAASGQHVPQHVPQQGCRPLYRPAACWSVLRSWVLPARRR